MIPPHTTLTVRLAHDAADLRAAQRLRYAVFVDELGGDGPLVDHAAGLEIDAYDAQCDHLLLEDDARPAASRVVGVYRLMRDDQAAAGRGFYSADEFDLSPLLATGRTLLELGRSCLHPAYRGGLAMHRLWTALGGYVTHHRAEVLFGTASFHGTDIGALRAPLSILHHRHLAPPALRVTARAPGARCIDLMEEAAIDRAAAMRAVPPLIKAYLRLGGTVGQGAYVDAAFNTTDVCLILDAARLTDRQAARYRDKAA